jgi:hypothetical protein
MDKLTKVKAHADYDDAIHYRRRDNRGTTLCGLKTKDGVVTGEPSCLRCRSFAAGDF